MLEDSRAVLLLGKICEESGHSYDWKHCELPLLLKNGKRIVCRPGHQYLVCHTLKVASPRLWATSSVRGQQPTASVIPEWLQPVTED